MIDVYILLLMLIKPQLKFAQSFLVHFLGLEQNQ